MIVRGKYWIKITVRVAERLAESQRSKGASSFGSPLECTRCLSSINTIKQGKESQKVKSVNRLQNEKNVRGNTSLLEGLNTWR